jgi:hypothetical protein
MWIWLLAPFFRTCEFKIKAGCFVITVHCRRVMFPALKSGRWPRNIDRLWWGMRRLIRLRFHGPEGCHSWALIGSAGSSTYGNWPATPSMDVVGLLLLSWKEDFDDRRPHGPHPRAIRRRTVGCSFTSAAASRGHPSGICRAMASHRETNSPCCRLFDMSGVSRSCTSSATKCSGGLVRSIHAAL